MPLGSVAPTVMTFWQFAGVKYEVGDAEFPAATMTTEPRARAPSIAACVAGEQVPGPPSERLRTFAGVAFAGTPVTEPPEAHVMAAMMSEFAPPHAPSTRTCWSRTVGATPVMP